ncbi:DUF5677 domain-containing protein [Microbacterium sp. OVT16B]|uniref:DUF5677 domain-containing protein n=1 Tax=Microbacterium sp. OVT16B TaxID=2862682 RepID=UPI001CBDD93C|nr:DUF5677 domain-containing protein [Microbacterium sp. OVT16B]
MIDEVEVDENGLAQGLLGLLQIRLTEASPPTMDSRLNLSEDEDPQDDNEDVVHATIDEYFWASMAPQGAKRFRRLSSERFRSVVHADRVMREETRTLRRVTARTVVDLENLNREFVDAFAARFREDKTTLIEALLPHQEILGGLALRGLLQGSLHARCVRLYEEIQVLAYAGFVEGAQARSRTLVETVAVLLAISRQDDDAHLIAERYHAWSFWENMSDRTPEIDSAIVGAWGRGFFSPYGWARPLISGKEEGRRSISMQDILRAVSMEPYIEEYRELSHSIHVGPSMTVLSTDFGSSYLFSTRPEGGVDEAVKIIRYATSLLGLASECFARDVFPKYGSFDPLGWLAPVLRRIDYVFRVCDRVERKRDI